MATIGLPLLARSLKNFKNENEDHQIDICGIVFNHSSSYSSGPEARQSITDVTKIAKAERWKVFDTHVTDQTSYAKAARERSAIGHTSYVRYPTIQTFPALFAMNFSQRLDSPGRYEHKRNN